MDSDESLDSLFLDKDNDDDKYIRVKAKNTRRSEDLPPNVIPSMHSGLMFQKSSQIAGKEQNKINKDPFGPMESQKENDEDDSYIRAKAGISGARPDQKANVEKDFSFLDEPLESTPSEHEQKAFKFAKLSQNLPPNVIMSMHSQTMFHQPSHMASDEQNKTNKDPMLDEKNEDDSGVSAKAAAKPDQEPNVEKDSIWYNEQVDTSESRQDQRALDKAKLSQNLPPNVIRSMHSGVLFQKDRSGLVDSDKEKDEDDDDRFINAQTGVSGVKPDEKSDFRYFDAFDSTVFRPDQMELDNAKLSQNLPPNVMPSMHSGAMFQRPSQMASISDLKFLRNEPFLPKSDYEFVNKKPSLTESTMTEQTVDNPLPFSQKSDRMLGLDIEPSLKASHMTQQANETPRERSSISMLSSDIPHLKDRTKEEDRSLLGAGFPSGLLGGSFLTGSALTAKALTGSAITGNWKLESSDRPWRNIKGSNASMDIPRPPDGGWGWVICAGRYTITSLNAPYFALDACLVHSSNVSGAFLCMVILDGMMFSFGVFLLDLLAYYGEAKWKTNMVGSILMGMHLFLGPVTSALVSKRWKR